MLQQAILRRMRTRKRKKQAAPVWLPSDSLSLFRKLLPFFSEANMGRGVRERVPGGEGHAQLPSIEPIFVL